MAILSATEQRVKRENVCLISPVQEIALSAIFRVASRVHGPGKVEKEMVQLPDLAPGPYGAGSR
jgi:hypothetical protein